MTKSNVYRQIKGQQKLNSVAMVKISIDPLALAFILVFFLCSTGNFNDCSEWSPGNESVIDERVIFTISVVFFPKFLVTKACWNLTALEYSQ